MHEKLGFQKSYELSDAQVRILLSLCSSNFITVDRTHDAFKSIMLNMKTLGDEVVFDDSLIAEDEFESFIEWFCVSLTYFLAGGNVPLLA